MNTAVSLTQQSILYSIIGIGVGIGTNKLSKQVTDMLGLKDAWTKTATQVVVISVVLALIQTYVSASFASDWNNITPGLFFVSFFFGLQGEVMSSIAQLNL